MIADSRELTFSKQRRPNQQSRLRKVVHQSLVVMERQTKFSLKLHLPWDDLPSLPNSQLHLIAISSWAMGWEKRELQLQKCRNFHSQEASDGPRKRFPLNS